MSCGGNSCWWQGPCWQRAAKDLKDVLQPDSGPCRYENGEYLEYGEVFLAYLSVKCICLFCVCGMDKFCVFEFGNKSNT
ncbi:MAG: hypothetical protein LBJ38_01335 [Oscillospiraceae bacterium]|nr:hypothetical protein [Oscillospiraceae bacterium]